jgi:hypothetical protein
MQGGDAPAVDVAFTDLARLSPVRSTPCWESSQRSGRDQQDALPDWSAMIVAHALTHAVAATDFVQAAGFLQTLRRAVLGFLVVVLLIGVLIGFFIGRAVGRRG